VILYSVQCCYAVHWTDNNHEHYLSVSRAVIGLPVTCRFSSHVRYELEDNRSCPQ